jgi:hypothetical protein
MAHEDAFMMVRWDITTDLAACESIQQVCNDVQICVPN